MKAGIPGNIVGDEFPLFDNAVVSTGYSARGIGVQIAVYVPPKNDFDSIVAFMTEAEAIGLIISLAESIREARTTREGIDAITGTGPRSKG